jgi:flagellar FliJ protein
MSRRFPLQALVDLSADRVDAAERRLQALDAERRQAKDKLAQVEAYRVEYRARLQGALAGGLDAARVREWHAFLARLDEACIQQASEVALREAAWLAGQQDWLEQRRRKKAFDALSDRHARSEAAREGKREQRLQDDHAQTMLRAAGRDPTDR